MQYQRRFKYAIILCFTIMEQVFKSLFDAKQFGRPVLLDYFLTNNIFIIYFRFNCGKHVYL